VPELPEVETVVRTLRPQLRGKTIRAVKLGKHRLRAPWHTRWNQLVAGATMVDITRRGKWMLIELSHPGCHMLVHLGMTGRLLVEPADQKPQLHTHFRFPLDDGYEELRFRDPRRFGSVTLATTIGTHRFPQEAELGPEPFDLTSTVLLASMQRSKRPLKAILLDQAVVAGVGNIYADESLFEAKLLPTRLGTSLTSGEAKRLQQALVKVLMRAIETKGSTISNFYYGNDEPGGFQHEFKAYGRAKQPCLRCDRPLTGIRLAGRTTCYCEGCQH
jgi:formamidopyrimidine-DNA glycosylase